MRLVDFREGAWLNPPASQDLQAASVTVVTDAKTDFWRETHYGFVRDTGHFLAFEAGQAFTAEVRVRAGYQALYDQAGLMIRSGSDLWVKCGVEYTDGRAALSTVLTRNQSDWSVTEASHDLRDVRIRATLKDGALRIQASVDGSTWPMLRLAPFDPGSNPVFVGPMCCTPERAGLRVDFTELRIGPPREAGLHDLS